MMRPVRFALLPVLVLGAAPRDDDDILAVKEWWGSFAITVEGEMSKSGKDNGLPWSRRRTVHRRSSGDFHLDRTTPGGTIPGEKPDLEAIMDKHRLRTWFQLYDRATPQTALLTVDEEAHATSTDPVEGSEVDRFGSHTTWTGRARVKIIASMPMLIVDAKKRTYALQIPVASMTSGEIKVTEIERSWSDTWDGQHEENTRTRILSGLPPGLRLKNEEEPTHDWIIEQSLPKTASPIKGSVTRKADFAPFKNPKLTVTISWVLTPRPPAPVDLVFEVDNYEAWRPKGSLSEDIAGSELKVRAWLESRNGGKVEDKARMISFLLTRVTREKGICINYPRNAKADPEPDLRFVPERNPSIHVNGDAKASRTGKDLTEARATISCFDWGAFGVLQVVAELDSGREIVGHWKNDPGREELRLPKSAETSWIADTWRSTTGAQGADDADDENDPAGDGNKGDGLTVYEEYRGYMMKGRWVSAYPDKKDFFIVDEIGGLSKAGIRKFREITGLEVHHDLRREEVDDKRVLNFNRTAGPQRCRQHAVFLQKLSAPGDCYAEGGPGNPRKISRVVITSSADPYVSRPGDEKLAADKLDAAIRDRSDYWASTMAHELGHCVNIFHHGDHVSIENWRIETAQDGTLSTWRVSLDDNGSVTGKLDKAPIRVYNENGGFKAPKSGGAGRILTVVVSEKFGQHSGDGDCVMRYDNAMAYRKAPLEYTWIDGGETVGTKLCDSTEGTVTDPFTGRPRHGPACPTNDRGRCRRQILVTDAVDAKYRYTDHKH